MTTQSLPLSCPGVASDDPQQREMILENISDGEKQLSFILRDDKHNYYKIPLYKGMPVLRGNKPDAWPVALLPTFFLRNDYDQVDTDQSTPYKVPLREGWLYIYVNGYLWRELQVISKGDEGTHFRDVNLAYERSAYPRPATGERCNEVVIPARLNYEQTLVEVGFSERQWSWERIDQLGGMNEEDPRQMYPNQGNEKNITTYSEGFCREQRTKRLTLLGQLNAFESHFEGVDLGSPILMLHNEAIDPYYREYLQTQFDQGVAAVVVDDAIGQARYYAQSQSEMMDMLDAIVKAMTEAELPPNASAYDIRNQAATRQQVANCRIAALLNNQYFAPIDQQLKISTLTDDEREALEDRVDERDLLDADLIEETLNLEGCDTLILKALDYRNALIELLDTPELLAAVEDFHSLEHAHWFFLPELLSNLIARLNQPVAFAYKDLFLDLNDYALHLENDPGADFLQRLAGSHATEPQHPLAALIFPKEGSETDNPLSIDESDPTPEELRLAPHKIKNILKGLNSTTHLNWPKIIIDGQPVDMHEFVSQAISRFTLTIASVPPSLDASNGAESAMIQSWRFMGHTVHAFGAKVRTNAHGSVRGIQDAEQKVGENSLTKADKDSELRIRTEKHEQLTARQDKYEQKIQQKKQSLQQANKKLDGLQAQRRTLLDGYGSVEELKKANAAAAQHLRSIDGEIHALQTEQTELNQLIDYTQKKRQQVQTALSHIDEQIQAIKQSDGMLSSHTLKLARPKQHNATVARLYALLAGDQLQILDISHSDLLADRIPDGLLPMSAPGRIKRLEEMLETAKRIKNHRGEWVSFELAPGKQVRVPADLAINDAERLQKYLAYYTHKTLKGVTDVSEESIKQVVIAIDALQSQQVQTLAQIESNNKTARTVTRQDKKIASLEQKIHQDEKGLYHLEGMFGNNAAELKETQRLIQASSNEIENLEATIKKYQQVLDNGELHRHFDGRMNKLFLLNGGMAVFEVFNLSMATEKVYSNSANIRSWVDMGSALIDFGATIASSMEFVFEAKYGTKDQINARLANRAKERFVKTLPVTEAIKRRSILIRGASMGFNIVSGFVSALISVIDAHNRWVLGDYNAAVAYGFVAVGFALTGVAALPALASCAITLNVVGFVILAIGFALVYFFTDTLAETLLKNCPFGADPEKRFSPNGWMSDFLDRFNQDPEQNFVYWEHNREQAYHDMLSFFFAPRIQFKEQWFYRKAFCEFTIITPALSNKGDYRIDLQIQSENNPGWETLVLISNNPNHRQNTTNAEWVMVTRNGPSHHIRLHQKMLLEYGLHRGTHRLFGFFEAVNTAESHLRLRVKTFPNGQGCQLFPGSVQDYVLPSPKRDKQGRALVNGKPVAEALASEDSWVVQTGRVIHGAY